MSSINNSIEKLQAVLPKAWSIETSSLWSLENPALGQCSVTALVVQDLLGGDILKTHLPAGWHFYNQINGQRYDLTASQFAEEIQYQDVLSSREDAFTDTSQEQYENLKERVQYFLKMSVDSKRSSNT